MENRRQKCDPTTTKSMNRRHWKEFSSTHYINVAAIIPGWTWHPTLKYAFLISFFRECVFCLGPGFRGSHYGSPCPPTYRTKTSVGRQSLTTLFVRQRWVNICQCFFDCVCCIVLEHKALCPSSVYPIDSLSQCTSLLEPQFETRSFS